MGSVCNRVTRPTFQGILGRRLRAQLVGDRRQQAMLAGHRLRPGVEQDEGAGAVRVLGLLHLAGRWRSASGGMESTAETSMPRGGLLLHLAGPWQRASGDMESTVAWVGGAHWLTKSQWQKRRCLILAARAPANCCCPQKADAFCKQAAKHCPLRAAQVSLQDVSLLGRNVMHDRSVRPV